MHPPGAETVLLRYGDIGVKSTKVRVDMERLLRENVAAILESRGVEAKVEREWSRLYVRVRDPEDVEDAVDAATDVFGVVSASSAVSVPPEKDEITEKLVETARLAFEGGSFAVRVRRAGKEEEHPFTSTELEEDGGSAVYENLEDDGYQPEVDLDDPDLLLRVECRKEEAFVFLEKREGPGGLPLGSQDGVVALLSGGIDSPVAAWHVMKRGCPVVPVYLDLGDYGGVDHRERAVETARRLNEYAPNHARGLRRVPAGDVVEELVDEVGDTRMLSYRRFMLRVAEEVAEEIGAVGIVTGGSVGQKSSQTSRNLRVIDAAVDMPVHRPLLSFDKQEIIDRAREIGTYDDSTVDVGCNRIAPDNPKTGARLSEVVEEEPEELLGRAEEVAEETVVENASSGNETRVVEGDGG